MKERAGSGTPANRLIREIDGKVARKLRARGRPRHSVWLGLRLFGLIGWSVILPILLGVAAGIWIDSRWPSRVSWTITLLFGGLVVGCLGAWRVIEGERMQIRSALEVRRDE